MTNARSFGSIAFAGALTTVAVGSVTARPSVSSPRAQVEVSSATQGAGTDLFIKRDTARVQTGKSLLKAYFQHDSGTRHKDSVTVETLIATLPDPIDSHLDYEFDVDLAAIRQAYEASGYVVDRFWLPWPLDREKAELSARQNRIDTAFYHRNWPGVILFRHVREHRLKLLYIVGEVPTSGIHTRAFDAAVADRDAVMSRHASDTLRVVGPAFSGGAPSLRETLLRTLAHRPGPISVISGSATGSSLREILQSDSLIKYKTTVHPDSLLDIVQRNVLCGWLGIPVPQIAVLKESSTLYGALGLATASPKGATERGCVGDFLEVPFPANISTLRSEYARAPNGETDPATGIGSSRLHVNLQDPARAMENPPVMSALTPAIVDGLLDEIARTLLHHRIRAVGILATDTRDKLFLAEQLRRRMRDLTLFTRESNILLVRRDINASLRGMLVFTTYPLELDAQRWNKLNSRGTSYAFGSNGAEGIFNATLIHLGNTAALTEYTTPNIGDAKLNCTPNQDDETRGASRIPPIWVLAVGRSSFFPITACGVTDTTKLMYVGPAIHVRVDASGVPRSGSYYIVCIMLFVLAIVMPFVAYQELQLLLADAPRRKADSVMRDVDWQLLSIQGHLYSMLRVFSLAIIGGALWLGLAHRLNAEQDTPTALIVATVACVVAGAVVLAAHGFWVGWRVLQAMQAIGRTPDEDGRRRWWSWIDLGGRVLIGATAIWYLVKTLLYFLDIRELGQSSPLRHALLLDRAGALDGGYSPAMLLALIGGMFLLWCSWHMNRINLLLASPGAFERASQLVDTSGKIIHPPARWQKSMRAVRTHLIVLLPDWISLLLAGTLLSVAVVLAKTMFTSYEALLIPTSPPMFLASFFPTSTTFDYLARFGVVAALCATGWALFRASRIWLDLQRTLGKLGRTHLITAFERLPRRIARLTRLNVLRPHADVLAYSVSSTQWAHLKRLYKEIGAQEQLKLADGLPQSQKVGSKVVSAHQYLTCLMQSSVVAWESRSWTADLGVTREDQITNERTSRREEAQATRFLFDLTEKRFLDEPTTAEVGKLVERLAGEKGPDYHPRSTAGQVRRLFGDNTRLWMRSAEELVAVQAVNYIQWVMHHLRYLTLYIVASLILITQLLSSYVFQPASILWLMVILLGITTTVVLLGIVIQMNRDEVLSRINGTSPGSVTWDLPFITNVAIVAVLPLLTFVGSAVPWLHDTLFSWVEPFVKALGRH